MVFDNPNWDFHTLNFDTDVAFADAKLSGTIDSTNADLHAFRARGGRLILYHGWADPLVNPRNSINYFNSVVRIIAGSHGSGADDRQFDDALREAQTFVRLFMAPGMTHCGGGPGLNAFGAGGPRVPQDAEHDILSALERWVEHRVAPDKIIATKYVNDDPAQGVVMTRPLCPYPQAAEYEGSGSPTDAVNFACRAPDPSEEAGNAN
jgi:hypothetical protein